MAISLCFSIFLFVDSVSLEKWNEFSAVGPVAMRIQGESLSDNVENIKTVPHVSHVSTIETSKAYLRMDQNDIYIGSPDDPLEPVFLVVGQAYSFNSDFSNSFPTEFQLVEGRYPINSSEIAIHASDAYYWGIPIGRMMNYSHFLNSQKRTVFVVGIFETSDDDLRSVTTDAVAIVTKEVLNPETTKRLAYVDVERGIFSAVDPKGSLSLLRSIESQIHSSNPSSSLHDIYYIDNYLAIGFQSYIDYLALERSRQITRVQIIIIVTGLLAFLGTRFNMMMREEEIEILRVRGATRGRILRKTLGELFGISFLACLVAYLTTPLITVIAWVSSGYLMFSLSNLNQISILFTVDSFVLLIFLGCIIPIFGLILNQMIRSVEVREVTHGRLARVSKIIRMIRWDVSSIVIIGLILLSLYVGGSNFNDVPVLSLLATYSTIPLFIAVASIFRKTWQAITKPLSRVFKRLLGGINSNLGIRGSSRDGKVSLIVVLILGVAISTSLANEVIATSLPTTQTIHSRFLIGGDLSFHLESDKLSNWSDFIDLVISNPNIKCATLVSIGTLSLSEGTAGVVEFIAVDPSAFNQVGYTYSGLELESSAQAVLLNQLDDNPDGAVLTADIATEYNLLTGDTLRAFSFGEDSSTSEFNILGITSSIPTPIVSGQPIQESVAGTRKIWLNRQYVQSLSDLNQTAHTFLCARVFDEANSTQVGLEILGEYGTFILSHGEWSSYTADLDRFVTQSDYRLDRSIDSMVTILMILSVFVSFVTYQVNQRSIRKYEYAMMKSMGISDGQLTEIRISEIIGIIILSLIIVLFFGLLDIANLLRMHFTEYAIWKYVFPISLFVQVNLISFFIVLCGLIIISISLIVILSLRSKIVDIADILRNENREGTMWEGMR